MNMRPGGQPGQMLEELLYLESGSHADALHLATVIST